MLVNFRILLYTIQTHATTEQFGMHSENHTPYKSNYPLTTVCINPVTWDPCGVDGVGLSSLMRVVYYCIMCRKIIWKLWKIYFHKWCLQILQFLCHTFTHNFSNYFEFIRELLLVIPTVPSDCSCVLWKYKREYSNFNLFEICCNMISMSDHFGKCQDSILCWQMSNNFWKRTFLCP